MASFMAGTRQLSVAVHGTVVYIDPYAGEGYSFLPTDFVTIKPRPQQDIFAGKEAGRYLPEFDALVGGKYNSITIGSVKVELSGGKQKSQEKDASGIVTADSKTIYFAGDIENRKWRIWRQKA